MMLKKVKIPNFIHHDDLGDFKFHDIEIFFDPFINEIDPKTFDQNNDEYFSL